MTDSRMGARWCRKEDEDLAELALNLNFHWYSIAQSFDKRSPQMCENRWNQVLSQGLIKGKWSAQEDSIIIESMKQGLSKWSEIAKRLPGNRVGKQCRERWCNHLDPTLKKTPWTTEEDAVMFQEQKKIGNSLIHPLNVGTKIALQLPGRSENEVKNRFNSTARKRKLASRRSEYDGSIEEFYDEDVLEGHQQDATVMVNKKKRYTIAPQKPTNLYRPSVPDGYMIISMSKDDTKALQTAEKLLNNLVPTDDPSCPFFINQLMSLLSMVPAPDLSTITSSLNMVPITSLADYDVPIRPHVTEKGTISTEDTDYDIESTKPLWIETNRDFRLNRDISLNRTVNKKNYHSINKEMEAEKSLWLPQRQASRSSAVVEDLSRQPILNSPSTLTSFVLSNAPSTISPGLSSTFLLPMTANGRNLPENLGSSLPSDFEEDDESTTLKQNTDYSKFAQFNDNSSEEIENAGGFKEEEGTSNCSSPFMFLEGLTQVNSPNWDNFFPTIPNSTSPIQFENCPSMPEKITTLSEKCWSQKPQKKRKWVRSPRSVLNDQTSRVLNSSPSEISQNMIDDDENSIVVVALQMLSGSSSDDLIRYSETRASPESTYNFSEISNGGVTDYMSAYSLSSTPWHSQPSTEPQTPFENDDPNDEDEIDNLKSVLSTFSLMTSSINSPKRIQPPTANKN